MSFLVIRTDTDGAASWESYTLDEHSSGKLIADLVAHLNTVGVARIEIITGDGES